MARLQAVTLLLSACVATIVLEASATRERRQLAPGIMTLPARLPPGFPGTSGNNGGFQGIMPVNIGGIRPAGGQLRGGNGGFGGGFNNGGGGGFGGGGFNNGRFGNNGGFRGNGGNGFGFGRNPNADRFRFKRQVATLPAFLFPTSFTNFDSNGNRQTVPIQNRPAGGQARGGPGAGQNGGGLLGANGAGQFQGNNQFANFGQQPGGRGRFGGNRGRFGSGGGGGFNNQVRPQFF